MRRLKLFLALALAASVCVPTVNVTNVTATTTNENVVEISNATELAAAIASQADGGADGQTWVLSAGEYVLTKGMIDTYSSLKINNATGFVFPITANNLTIVGEGDVTITSDYDPNTGNWNGQNFVTIGGNGVTIENVTLKANYNTYYDGTNKVVELVNAKDLTLKDVDTVTLESESGKFGGSIYINTKDAGNTVLENVTLSAWVSAGTVTEGNVTVKNLTIDFTDNAYAGYYSDTYGYAWNPGVSGSNVNVESMTIKVDDKTNLPQQIAKDVRDNTTIELASDITLDEGLYFVGEDDNPVENLTINGNGHTITASDTFHTNSYGQNNLVKFDKVENAVLENVTLETNELAKHVLDVYDTTLTIENVTLDHTTAQSGAPLIVNQSDVTLKGDVEFVTGANSWYAVNVDARDQEASLNVDDNAVVTFGGDTTKLPVFVSNSTGTSTVTGLEDLGNGVYGEVAATIGENKYSSVQLAVDAAKDGETVVVASGRHEEEVKILNKAIKLVGEEGAELFGVVAVNTTDEELEGLTIENIHFYGASNLVSLDTNASTIYLQGKYKDVVIKDNELILEETLGNAPYTVAITTGAGINGMLVENNVIKNYTMSAYHNPDWANPTVSASNDISYVGNSFENILSGIYFGGTENVTVTDNTFTKANGVRFAYGSTIADLSENAFVSRPDDTSFGSYAVRFYEDGVSGEANLSDNYWGTTDIESVIANESEDFEYTLDTYYVSADRTDKNTDTNVFELDSLEVELQEGATLTVNVTAKDHEGNPVPVTWTSQDESVATVKDGVITAVKEGQTVIVANANGVTREIKVTVVKAGSNVPTNPETPTDPDTGSEDKPTETPNTSDMSLIGCYGMMALLSLAILVVLNKKRALSK